MRSDHRWTSEFVKSFKNGFGVGSSILKFKCGTVNYEVKLYGAHVDKKSMYIEMDKARLMREKGDKFFFMVDMTFHGVNWLTRKRGGYTLFTMERSEKVACGWEVKRYFYSRKESAHCNVEDKTFPHVFWRIIRGCYYNVAIVENLGDDNSG